MGAAFPLLGRSLQCWGRGILAFASHKPCTPCPFLSQNTGNSVVAAARKCRTEVRMQIATDRNSIL